MAVTAGFTIDVCVAVVAVATTSGSMLIGNGFLTSLTLNCLFMGVWVLFFLLAAFLGTVIFHGEVVLPT